MDVTLSSLANAVALFAQDAPAGAPAAGDPWSLLQGFSPLIAIFVFFYFIMIRPQQRERSRRLAMLAEIKKNDRVVTAGGIYGIVTNVNREADEVTVKVDEATNTKLRMTLSSVTTVLGDGPSDETANK